MGPQTGVWAEEKHERARQKRKNDGDETSGQLFVPKKIHLRVSRTGLTSFHVQVALAVVFFGGVVGSLFGCGVFFFAPSFNQILVANFRDAPPCFSRARPWKTKNKFSEIVFQQVRAIIRLRMFRRVWWHSLLQLLYNYAVAIIMQTLVDLDDFHLRSLRDLKQLPVLHSTPAIFELVYEVEVG